MLLKGGKDPSIEGKLRARFGEGWNKEGGCMVILTGWMMALWSIRVMTGSPGKNKARKKMFQAWWGRAAGNYTRNDDSSYCEICVRNRISFIMLRLR